jgi:hypothetical protein
MPGVVMRTVAALVALWFAPSTPAWTDEMRLPPKTYYRTATVGGHAIFYREAGDPARPTIVLLHGFPSTSHEFRELIPLLSQDYHVVAPDYLGSGYSDHPDPNVEPYTFDRLADAIQDFLDVLGLKRYTLYMTDFGGPRVPPDGARPQGRRSHHRAECQLLSRRIDAGASDLLPPRP